MVLEVDDILEAGNERHREKMTLLEKKLRFGKVVKLEEVDAGSSFACRRLQQLPDFLRVHCERQRQEPVAEGQH